VTGFIFNRTPKNLVSVSSNVLQSPCHRRSKAAKTDMLAAVKQWMLSDVAWHPSVSNSCISSETVSPEQRFVHMTLCLPVCETLAYRLRRVSSFTAHRRAISPGNHSES
jgi:hypothetical protein